MVSTMKIVDTKRGASRLAVGSGVRVNRTGRRTYPLEYKRDLVRQCREPGVSVSALALAHGINANLVRKWIRQQRALPAASAMPQAILLPVTTNASVKPAADARAGSPRSQRLDEASIEIEIYGARIRLRGGVDATTLRDVLTVLGQR